MIADHEGLKRCPGCTLRKPPGSFNKSKYEVDGRDVYCKYCRNRITKKWRRDHPEVYLVCQGKEAMRKRNRYAEEKRATC